MIRPFLTSSANNTRNASLCGFFVHCLAKFNLGLFLVVESILEILTDCCSGELALAFSAERLIWRGDFDTAEVVCSSHAPSIPWYTLHMHLLGTSEELFLLAIDVLQPYDADASSIQSLLGTTIGKTVTVGALYTTINRLVTKQLISKESVRGDSGQIKSIYHLTESGHQSLKANKEARQKLEG